MTEVYSQEEFLLSFKELIKFFADNPNINNGINISSTDNLFASLTLESSAYETLVEQAAAKQTSPNSARLAKRFTEFITLIEDTQFENKLIPYEKITECVFGNTPEEMLHTFTSELRKYGDTYFNCEDQQSEEQELNKKNFYKIVRHIDLALIQKYSFADLKIRDMEKLRKENAELNNSLQILKNEAETQYKSLLTQFISILGIFAAILMGSIGALQGFTSLFANAHQLSLGKLLIISSIGASSVVVILFLLLNGIAKLIDRSLSSSKNENATLYEKHPTIIIVFGILIFISLIGVSLELSNIHLNLAWQGLWWIIPLLWMTYLLWALAKKDFLFFLRKSS